MAVRARYGPEMKLTYTGQGAFARHPTYRGLYVLGRHAPGLRRGLQVAQSIRESAFLS